MALSSAQANTFTITTIANNLTTNVNAEIAKAEIQIRNVISAELFKLAFNATIIGNPLKDPIVDVNLNAEQISFRDNFINNGYKISLDVDTGFWGIDWSQVGTELTTNVYSIRTSVAPGSISAQTISASDTYFGGLSPTASSKTTIVPFNGGDVAETDFGAVNSVFYEYVALVDQQDTLDLSTGLKTALKAAGLGYTDDTRVTGAGTSGNSTANTNTLDVDNGVVTVTVTVGGTGLATDLVAAINVDAVLIGLQITAEIAGSDLIVKNNLAGNLNLTNNVGNVLLDLFALATSPQAGVLTDNLEVYKLV